jgi:transcriptional regulator with XRE-family HTH domain
MSESMKTIGSMIKAIREKSGLSQQELGDKWRFTRQTIAAYERGEIPDNNIPPVEELILEQFDRLFLLCSRLQNERDEIKIKLVVIKTDLARIQKYLE